MRTFLVFLAFTLSSLGYSQYRTPKNMSFEDCTSPGRNCALDYWFLYSFNFTHTIRQTDRFAVDGDYSAVIKRERYSPYNGNGSLGQCVHSWSSRDDRVELSGYLKGRDIYQGFAGLWLRVDDAYGNILTFVNGAEEGLEGDFDWERVKARTWIPRNAARVCYGAWIAGFDGTLYVDKLDLDFFRGDGETDLELYEGGEGVEIPRWY